VLNPSTAISNRITGSEAEIERLFGTPDQFMERYRAFQQLYINRLRDPQNLSYNVDPARLATAMRRGIDRL
jgi:hypothetical protein